MCQQRLSVVLHASHGLGEFVCWAQEKDEAIGLRVPEAVGATKEVLQDFLGLCSGVCQGGDIFGEQSNGDNRSANACKVKFSGLVDEEVSPSIDKVDLLALCIAFHTQLFGVVCEELSRLT